MEHPPADLSRSRKGFTLIELLLALALTSVVTALAWIVLDSTRNVSEEISAPVENPLEPLWAELQFEYDRLLPKPVKAEIPALRFADDTGLEMVSLLPNTREIPLQTELHYFVKESQLLRVSRILVPPLSETNLIARQVTALRIRAHNPDAVTDKWPPEKSGPLPHRLTVELVFANGSSQSRDFFIPASMRMEKSRISESTP